jgi:ATP-binding cassette subfamily B protein
VRHNLEREYPGMTVLAVTQRIATIADYDQIFLLMEGELLARGTHQELLESCPEYAQIYDSQKSTHHYE